jgi:hypothetical protein
MLPPLTISDFLARCDASAGRVAEIAGQMPPNTVTALADLRAMFATDLIRRPAEMTGYLEVAHAELMTALRGAAQHDAGRVVRIRAEDGFDYSMTPRKALRRELDHAIDHLNQIDQWTAWHDHGTAPVPTDGWAGSDSVIGDDREPIQRADLDAWLWRIDITWQILVRRSASLPAELLDWTPPEADAWTLRQVLRHVGRASMHTGSITTCPTSPSPVTRKRASASTGRSQRSVRTTRASSRASSDATARSSNPRGQSMPCWMPNR